MATELPYFRFTVQEWQNGNISLERYELQGLFISVCGFYWLQDCSITLALLQKKFSNTTMLKELIDLGIIKHEKRHDKIEIVFLNKQYDLLSEKRKLRQVAGSKGGNAKAMLKQKGSYKDKDNNKDKDKDNKETKFNFRNKLIDYGFSEKLVDDWLIVRKDKKASNTETAYNSFILEVESKIINLDFVLETCCERSWSGFKHKWLENLETNSKKENGNSKTNDTIEAVNRLIGNKSV